MTPQEQNIPYGLCNCGCGRTTTIIKGSDATRGLVRGQPRLFISGHHFRIRPVVEDAVPFKLEGDCCRLIPLSQGFYAIVNATDYLWLMQWKWFVWRSADGNHYARRGDRERTGKQQAILMHREILGLLYGDRRLGDHIQCGNTLDNRRRNLRIADPSQSSANQRKRRDSTTTFKGVHRARNRWHAVIHWRNRRIPLGYFDTPEEAYAAYCEASKQYHGEFGRTA